MPQQYLATLQQMIHGTSGTAGQERMGEGSKGTGPEDPGTDKPKAKNAHAILTTPGAMPFKRVSDASYATDGSDPA